MGKGKTLTEEQVKEIIQQYLLQKPIIEIAKTLQISKSSIWSHLRTQGLISTSKRARIFTNEQVEEINSLYIQGNSSRKIASILGVAVSTVTQVLKDKNIKLDRTGRPKITDTLSQDEINKIITMYSNGIPTSQIGHHFNLSRDVIRKYLHTWGVPVKKAPLYKKLLSNEQITSICNLYQQRETIDNLATAYNLNQNTIKTILRDNNVKVSHKKIESNKKVLSLEQQQEVIMAYKQGGNFLDIGEKFGVSKYTIERIIKTNNIPIKKNYKRALSSKKEKEVIEAYKKRVAISDIAKDFSVSENTIRRILKANIS